MDSNYFVLSPNLLTIDRFHICSWEFVDNTGLVEFGCDIRPLNTNISVLSVEIYIPWLKELIPNDLYSQLKSSDNSKFIFNDSILATENLNGRSGDHGVIHHFSERKLCLLPIRFNYQKKKDGLLTIDLDLEKYNELTNKPNIYFRFFLEPPLNEITTRRLGIAKSSVIYDIKVNERRNLPVNLPENKLSKIERCFCFHIIPNNYEVSFVDPSNLKNIRNLEFEGFAQYLPLKKIKDQELIVVFNQKKDDNFSFFNIYTKEFIGRDQIIVGVFINLFCSILFIVPSYRLYQMDSNVSFFERLPFELYIGFGMAFLFTVYLFRMAPKTIYSMFRKKK